MIGIDSFTRVLLGSAKRVSFKFDVLLRCKMLIQCSLSYRIDVIDSRVGVFCDSINCKTLEDVENRFTS